MKKKLIILLFFLCIAMLCFVSCTQMKVASADRAIDRFLAGEEYRNASPEERKTLAEGLLNELEEKGMISQISYDETVRTFSFVYCDGTLGGLALNDFAAQPGSLPMN